MQISQRHADRPSEATTHAATLVVSQQLDGDAAKALVMDYLRETVPEALAAVGPAWPALALRIEAKQVEVMRRPLTVLARGPTASAFGDYLI